MAFANADIDAIVAYLGYPVNSSSVITVKDACTKVSSLSPDAEVRIKSYLSSLGAIEVEIKAARVNVGGAYQQLKGEGRRYVKWISESIQVEVNKDVF